MSKKSVEDVVDDSTTSKEEVNKAKIVAKELEKKKRLLSEYELNGGHLNEKQIKSLKKSSNFKKSNSAFNIFDINDLENTKNIEYSKNVSAKENLIKVLDAQVDLLKRQSNDQFKKLSETIEYNNNLFKTKRYRNILNNEENGLQ